MSQDLNMLLQQLETAKTVMPDDVLALRREVFGDGHVSVSEADAIFRLNAPEITRCVQWADFFMESMTDFIVRQTLPYGYVDESNASWLITRISHDGRVETTTELRTLINILKTARNSTQRLVSFALEQVKFAVIDGTGVIGRGRTLQPGVIGEAEASLLRAVLFACGGEDDFAVSRNEAEIIFDINDACRGSANHPSWKLLFRQTIANHLMYISTHSTPSRDEALRRENFLNERSDIKNGFKKLSMSAVIAAFKSAPEDTGTPAMDAKVMRGEMITESEAKWLQSRIGRDGDFDENERELISWLAAESPQIHTALLPLLNAA